MVFKFILVALLVVPVAALGLYLLNNLFDCFLQINKKKEKK